MSLDLNAIRERADAAQNCAHGSGALFTVLASANDVPPLLAEVRRLAMYHDRYWAVQEVLNEALGPNEEDGTGDGIAADVALVVQQREEAISALAAVEQGLDRLQERLAAAETVCTIFGWTGYGEEGKREKAAVQAYMDWANTYGAPRPNPEWNERVHLLAAKRDGKRAKALASIRTEPSGTEAGQ